MKNFFLLLIFGICSLYSCKQSVAQEAQDWPNLAKYSEANSKLDHSTMNNQRIVFMGNSITEGWGERDFFKNPNYINRGIGGQTTPQMLVRFRQDVVDLKPKAVIILAGINDIAGNTGPSTIKMISDNINSMTEIALANNIEVVLCSTLPAYDFPWSPGKEPAPKVIALNKMIKAFANQKDVHYLDYYSAMVDERQGMQKKFSYDEVHCTPEGYEMMEKLVTPVITEILK